MASGATRRRRGAVLLLALGVRKFAGRYHGVQGLILGTYWAGIAGIAWSAHGAG